jgi:hypothetical protein
MDTDELRELCTLTVELTRLRQNECKHLCIENFAPELLGKLIRERLAMGLAAPDEALRLAVERTRDDLGPDGTNYPAVRKLLAFAERAIEFGRA